MKTFVLLASLLPTALSAQVVPSEETSQPRPSVEKRSVPSHPLPRARVVAPPEDREYHLRIVAPEPRYDFKILTPRTAPDSHANRPKRPTR
jgi:hypothetical protein